MYVSRTLGYLVVFTLLHFALVYTANYITLAKLFSRIEALRILDNTDFAGYSLALERIGGVPHSEIKDETLYRFHAPHSFLRVKLYTQEKRVVKYEIWHRSDAMYGPPWPYTDWPPPSPHGPTLGLTAMLHIPMLLGLLNAGFIKRRPLATYSVYAVFTSLACLYWAVVVDGWW